MTSVMFRLGVGGSSGMAFITSLLVVMVLVFVTNVPVSGNSEIDTLLNKRRELESRIRQVRSMFRHAYDSYMENAYPADELMPISCAGRIRGVTQSRGDIDDALGNFSLTLVDTLDTLFLLNDLDEFERAVRRVIQEVRFDTDVVVSVFEANIRMLGGLISAHVAAGTLQQRSNNPFSQTGSKHSSSFSLTKHANATKTNRHFAWYSGELLQLAVDLADRLLVAFNESPSGLPYARVNLKHGVTNPSDAQSTTCTACAGTFLLEFGALSRLTKDPRYERAARRALDFIWEQRNAATDLVGTVLNIHNGEWIRKESSVGAGIDSYYEYLIKAYVLFDDREMLRRFEAHYSAVMRFLYRNAFVHDALMNRPGSPNRPFVDALFAFWPSVQVMNGDVHRAVELHETLAHVHRKHGFLPEAFTAADNDFSAFWEHHLLRPELAESTYFLFAATRDPYYTQIGAQIADNLERHARTPCGYAALSSVHTKQRSDQMDSYVLAETFKYLHLLFVESLAAFDAAHPTLRSLQAFAQQRDHERLRRASAAFPMSTNCSDSLDSSDASLHDDPLEAATLLPIDINEYVFTTEAHLLPLSLARVRLEKQNEQDVPDWSVSDTCANTLGRLDAALNASGTLTAAKIRHGVRELVRGRGTATGDSQTCDNPTVSPSPTKKARKRMALKDIVWNNPEHLRTLSQLGLDVTTMPDGRMQISFAAEKARSTDEAAEGIKLLNEVIEITKANGGHLPVSPQDELQPVEYRYVQIMSSPYFGSLAFKSGPAQFGPHLRTLLDSVTGEAGAVSGPVRIAKPFDACTPLDPSIDLHGAVVLTQRGGCMFVEKTLAAQRAGAVAVLVLDDSSDSDVESSAGFTMSGDSKLDPLITVPAAFLFRKQADFLLHLIKLFQEKFSQELVARLGTEPTRIKVPAFALSVANQSVIGDGELMETTDQPASTEAQPKAPLPDAPQSNVPLADEAPSPMRDTQDSQSNDNFRLMRMWTVHIVPARVWQVHGPQNVPIIDETLVYDDLVLARLVSSAPSTVERSLFIKITDLFMRTNRELLRGRPFVFYATLAQTIAQLPADRFAMLNDPARYELFMLTVIKQTLAALLRGGSLLVSDDEAAKRFAAVDDQKRDPEETEDDAFETMWLWTKNVTDGSCRLLRMRTTEPSDKPADGTPEFSQVYVDSRELNDIQLTLDVLAGRIVHGFDVALVRQAVATADASTKRNAELEEIMEPDDDEEEAELQRAGVSSSVLNSFVNSLFSHLVRDTLGENLARMLLGTESKSDKVPVPVEIHPKEQKQVETITVDDSDITYSIEELQADDASLQSEYTVSSSIDSHGHTTGADRRDEDE